MKPELSTESTSAQTPADGYVLPGCIAFARLLHQQKLSPAEALLLLELSRADDLTLDENQVRALLDCDSIHGFHFMKSLEDRDLVTLKSDPLGDFLDTITLTKAGHVECLAIFGAVMLAAD